MGKRYHCEYCDKTMVAAPSIVKTHNKGMVHQKMVQEHYQQFKDPETILAEESTKQPCTRFARGICQFGRICRFSHYTKEQLDSFKDYVSRKNLSNADITHPSFEDLYLKLQNEKSMKQQISDDTNTVLVDMNGVTHVFPWTYNRLLDNFDGNLPPSIKRLKIEDFIQAEVSEWG